MKKARLTAWILAAVLCAGTALSGCGNAEETAEEEVIEIEPIEEEEEAEPEEEEEVVEIQEIGDPTASIEIMLTNEMGDAITGLSIKSPLEKEYPDNMMTSDQKIEDKETVKLFCEPVTEEDIEPADDEAIRPDESYVGYWGESDDVDETGWELTIFETTDDYIIFHLWGYRTADSDDYIIATFDSDNVGSFSTYLNGDKAISGTITFYKDSVVVNIEQSEFQMTTPAIFDFGEKHNVSREEGNNKPLEQWEEDKEYVYVKADIDSITTETTEEPTYFLQVTLENGDVYELIDFDVEDMAEVTLYLEDGVAYIEYMSLSQNILISTKEKETQIKEDKEAAQVVIDMIDAIGTVTEDNAEEHRDEIEAARAAYDALTDAQKAYVTNYQLLVEMEKLLGIQTDDGARNEEAYQAGYYCGDNGYTMEDAEARAAELGYALGSKLFQDFWDGYNYGLENRNGGDFYAIGYQYGKEGHSEDEARVYLTSDGTSDDPKSQYTKDYWNGYYAGYAEYENERFGLSRDNAQHLGYDLAYYGYSWEAALVEAKNQLGITPDSGILYDDFKWGYDYYYSQYGDQNQEEEPYVQEEEPYVQEEEVEEDFYDDQGDGGW